MERQGIIAAGNWIVDRVKIIDAWPSQDALVSILSESASNGGGPYNVAKDLAKLFAGQPPFPIRAAGLVGDDPDGRWILDDCRAHDILTDQLKSTAGAPTSYTDVMTVQSTGRRTFFHQRGANALFSETDLDFTGTTSRLLYLGYLLLLDSLDAERPGGETGASLLLQAAKEADLRTVVDLVSEESQRFQQVIRPALRHTDVLLTNEFEASRLSGVDLVSDFSARSATEAARVILEMGVREMVVIHAPAGALILRTGQEENEEPLLGQSLRVPSGEIAGAVGAGDAFAAGFVYGLHEGLPLDETLRVAACVAASCLRHPTTSGGILPLKECLALAEKWGLRDFGSQPG